jgi:hypothetical protein
MGKTDILVSAIAHFDGALLPAIFKSFFFKSTTAPRRRWHPCFIFLMHDEEITKTAGLINSLHLICNCFCGQ